MSKLYQNIRLLFDQWVVELSSWIPQSWRELFFVGYGDSLVLEVEQPKILVYLNQRQQLTLLEEFPTEAATREAFIKQYPMLMEHPVSLALGESSVLSSKLRIPQSAEKEMHSIIGFEIDRLTPFQREAVVFDCWREGILGIDGQINLEIRASPKAGLIDSIERLVQLGWQVTTVFPKRDLVSSSHCNLLPEEFREKPDRLSETIGLLLKLGPVILFFIVLLLPLFLTESNLEQMKERSALLLKSSKEVDQLKQETEKLIQESRFLEKRKTTLPILTDSIEELTRITPDDTSLDSFQFSDGSLILQGSSQSASRFIEKIEESAYFDNTKFLSPVTKDVTNDLERFQIGTDLANGRYSKTHTGETQTAH